MQLKHPLLLIIIYAYTFVGLLANPKLGYKINYKIVGGYPCQIQEHPYMVSIRYVGQNIHICGGTLISEQWVLTAAHCVNRKNSSLVLRVLAGSTNAVEPDSKNAQTTTAKAIHTHPLYDFRSLAHDIALLELNSRMRETDHVKFVNLAMYLHLLNRTLEEICTNATVVGWGIQNAKQDDLNPSSKTVLEYDPNLHCTHLAVTSAEKCEQHLQGITLPSKVFCAFAPNKGFCKGDSGGPLICHGVQYGIICAGVGCAHPKYPGIYTQVDQYWDFLNSTIVRSSCGHLYLFTYLFYVFWISIFDIMCTNFMLLK